MTWDETDLVAAWRAAQSRIPKPFALQGVTYHGPNANSGWVAFTYSEELGQFGPEGAGPTPVEAIEALLAEAARNAGSVAD